MVIADQMRTRVVDATPQRLWPQLQDRQETWLEGKVVRFDIAHEKGNPDRQQKWRQLVLTEVCPGKDSSSFPWLNREDSSNKSVAGQPV